MRKTTIILLFILFPLLSLAQRAYKGQCRVEAAYGIIATGHYSQDVSLRFSQYLSVGQWQVGLSYASIQSGVSGTTIPCHHQQTLLLGGYDYTIYYNYKKSFFVSAGGNALVGYEFVQNELSPSLIISAKDRFIYGAALEARVEYFILRNIGININISERLTAGSDVQLFHTVIGFGLTYLFN